MFYYVLLRVSGFVSEVDAVFTTGVAVLLTRV
jgi:hypothetical protein